MGRSSSTRLEDLVEEVVGGGIGGVDAGGVGAAGAERAIRRNRPLR